MLCTVCKIEELGGSQRIYCSKKCEQKGWRDKNKEKVLEGKRKYREANRDKISLYDKAYKSKTLAIKPSLSNQLKKVYICLRCSTNENLEVHHIKHQRYGGLPNDLNNVVVLCKSCHALWHKFFDNDYWISY